MVEIRFSSDASSELDMQADHLHINAHRLEIIPGCEELALRYHRAAERIFDQLDAEPTDDSAAKSEPEE